MQAYQYNRLRKHQSKLVKLISNKVTRVVINTAFEKIFADYEYGLISHHELNLRRNAIYEKIKESSLDLSTKMAKLYCIFQGRFQDENYLRKYQRQVSKAVNKIKTARCHARELRRQELGLNNNLNATIER